MEQNGERLYGQRNNPGYMKINPHTPKARLSSKYQETQKEHNSVPLRNHILAIKTGILKDINTELFKNVQIMKNLMTNKQKWSKSNCTWQVCHIFNITAITEATKPQAHAQQAESNSQGCVRSDSMGLATDDKVDRSMLNTKEHVPYSLIQNRMCKTRIWDL